MQVLLWNVECRTKVYLQLCFKNYQFIGTSDNIDDVMLSNIDWENDALTIGTMKADQIVDRKRMYANSYEPELFDVLQ